MAVLMKVVSQSGWPVSWVVGKGCRRRPVRPAFVIGGEVPGHLEGEAQRPLPREVQILDRPLAAGLLASAQYAAEDFLGARAVLADRVGQGQRIAGREAAAASAAGFHLAEGGGLALALRIEIGLAAEVDRDLEHAAAGLALIPQAASSL